MKRSTDNRRSPAEVRTDLQKRYGGLEHSNADMTDFRRPAYSVRHPKDGYADTQNMSTGQQNEAEYPENEYSDTQNTSMADRLLMKIWRKWKMSEIKLKPCPFCGEEAILKRDRTGL